MSAALHLAGAEDLDRLDGLVAGFHAEEGIALSPERRRAGLVPLLEGSPYGAAYLIGPARAPVGYVVITFTWSVEFGGLNAILDEIYLRPAVRGRGIAVEALNGLSAELFRAGVVNIDLEVAPDNVAARKLYERAGFRPREGYLAMHRPG